MDNLNTIFPDRRELRQESILDAIRELDASTGVNERKVEVEVTQKQGTYAYIRIYLNEEDNTLKSGDIVTLGFPEGNELFETTFVSYGKDVGKKRDQDELVDYVPEDNKKVLCLMFNVDSINTDSDNIPFIRSLFKVGRYFEYQLFKYEEFTVESKEKSFEFFDIDFG